MALGPVTKTPIDLEKLFDKLVSIVGWSASEPPYPLTVTVPLPPEVISPPLFAVVNVGPPTTTPALVMQLMLMPGAIKLAVISLAP